MIGWNSPAETSLRKLQYKLTLTCCDGSSTTGLTRRLIAILANLRRAAGRGTQLLLVESVIPETGELDVGKWMDMNMLVMAGGCERTAAEFRQLYDQAGWELEQIIPTPSPLNIIVGRPRA